MPKTTLRQRIDQAVKDFLENPHQRRLDQLLNDFFINFLRELPSSRWFRTTYPKEYDIQTRTILEAYANFHRGNIISEQAFEEISQLIKTSVSYYEVVGRPPVPFSKTFKRVLWGAVSLLVCSIGLATAFNLGIDSNKWNFGAIVSILCSAPLALYILGIIISFFGEKKIIKRYQKLLLPEA